jgi:hypothetical protein
MDSGAHLFLGGECYYRQLNDLALSFSIAKDISGDHWREYLHGGLKLIRKLGWAPTVSMAAFLGAVPNAGQRRMVSDHLVEHQLPRMQRVALLTDSAAVRGAMMAFGWIMPNASLRAFAPSDVTGCLRWLREVGVFDQKLAAEAWSEARLKLTNER